jgi:hypothetical protein
MSSESVCQVARSWVDVGSFHTRLVARFMIFTASVRNILDSLSYKRILLHFNFNVLLTGEKSRCPTPFPWTECGYTGRGDIFSKASRPAPTQSV